MVATIARKLGIPPPSQLTAFKLPTTEKKKKRRTELIHEVFVKKNIVVDGMQRNLVPPQGVVRSVGLDQNAIKIDSIEARKMFDKMIYVIEARDDVVEARKIVQEK
ncbi:hypothetical protein Tco_0937553 [Tanacetum coccineum]|uniref:Uncharacterized protein n=1 Tax=Tanacetum coccineum TaxID=301880 RepID=A0ABQ5DFI1_9ASTR